MNAVCQSWITELESKTRATARLIEVLPEEHLTWRPHAKSYTLGQLAWHTAALPAGVGAMLANDVLDASTVDFSTPQPKTVAAIAAELERSFAAARAALQAWSTADLERTWRIESDGRTLMAAPRGVIVRGLMLNHLYHHRGQLTVYLRLLDRPLPSIYGPSADVNPFAS